MKKIFFLSLIFTFSSIVPLMAENKFYKYPWYWVYKKKSNCEYTVAVREDMPTHMATMEWIDVDICKKITKLRTY